MSDEPKLKVYYNSACPVCNAGIEMQKNRMSGCPVAWKNVHADNNHVREIGSDLEFVRERLHAADDNGNVFIGFDAFLAIWRNNPDEHWKAVLFGTPGIRQVCQLAYNLFAAGLYKWNRAKHRW